MLEDSGGVGAEPTSVPLPHIDSSTSKGLPLVPTYLKGLPLMPAYLKGLPLMPAYPKRPASGARISQRPASGACIPFAGIF